VLVLITKSINFLNFELHKLWWLEFGKLRVRIIEVQAIDMHSLYALHVRVLNAHLVGVVNNSYLVKGHQHYRLKLHTYLNLMVHGEGQDVDESINLEHTEKEYSEVLEGLREEIPEQAQVRCLIRDTKTVRQ
jgi:energy-converting hydrogenase A subunit M